MDACLGQYNLYSSLLNIILPLGADGRHLKSKTKEAVVASVDLNLLEDFEYMRDVNDLTSFDNKHL